MLTVYGIEQSEKWDEIVRSFIGHDVYWLSGYVKAFQIHGDGEPMLLYYEGNGTRGINVVMKRDIAQDKHFENTLPQGQYYDFASPYGYGGWIIEGQDVSELDAEYQKYCKQNSIVSEFVRFHPMLQNQIAVESIYEVIPLGETVAMELQPEECIWENIISKNRNVIRKAQKNGVTIQHDLSKELLETFRGIYNATMDKDDAESYYYFGEKFYDSILTDLKDNAQLFYATLEDKIIAVAIMIFANGRMNYHLSGSVREYSSLAPSNLMLFEAAKWGSSQGFKTFYLGGGVGSGEDSLFKFKKAFFRGELHRFHIGRKIMIPDVYNILVEMRTDLPESGFFPKYRA